MTRSHCLGGPPTSLKAFPPHRPVTSNPALTRHCLRAIQSGKHLDFEAIARGSGRRFVSPQAAYAFCLEGGDLHPFGCLEDGDPHRFPIALQSEPRPDGSGPKLEPRPEGSGPSAGAPQHSRLCPNVRAASGDVRRLTDSVVPLAAVGPLPSGRGCIGTRWACPLPSGRGSDRTGSVGEWPCQGVIGAALPCRPGTPQRQEGRLP